MGFLHPELLCLALPAAFAVWKLRTTDPWTSVLRALLVAALVLALAGPYLRTADRGRDLVLVVDRSRSMPAGSNEVALELARLADAARADGDRLAVVAFGADAVVERLPSADAPFARFQRTLDADGSDLGRALDVALDLIPPERQGSVLLVSDGEDNGRDPLPAARRAFARGVRIDVRPVARPDVSDLSVERVDAPEEVGPGEPFQFSAWVRSDRRVEAGWTLQRGASVLARGRRSFEAGLNRVVLRDVVLEPGVADYRFALDAAADRVPENDAAIAAVRVGSPRSILLVNDDGSEGALARALGAAAIPVVVASPETARLDATGLVAHRAVILENVAASRLGGRLRTLAAFVTDLGGGLLVTGGRASFGTGGYFKSVLDPVLPVSMELRQEHRKQAIALGITLDRSGSMAAPAGQGLSKMDLANLGAAAAIELLSPLDSVAVHAVDSAYHVIQELARVEDPGAIVGRVRRVQSMGGGIFTYTALLAIGQELERAEQATRHVILFADAADAEEQERCPELLSAMVRAGMSVSVIALGSESDVDAQFLKAVAEAGGGTAYFTTDPDELPRLFAQDTLTVARSTFVEERTATRALPDLFALGPAGFAGFAELDGYNLTYLRSGAVAGVVTADENAAPVFAFQQSGLGRCAAFTGQVGGTFGAPLIAWPGFADFFATVARWLVGQEEPSEVFASVRRDGREAVVAVDVDPERASRVDLSKLEGRLRTADGTTRALVFERVGEHRYEARARLASEGVALGSVAVGDGRTIRLPPVALPYSPEFERGADTGRGEHVLRRIARASGGTLNPAATELFRGERASRGWRPIGRELALLALALLVLEIAVRRLELASFARVPAPLARAWRELRARRSDRAEPLGPAGAPAGAPAPTSVTPPAPGPAPTSPVAEGDATASDNSVEGALARARRAAGKRLER
ncbi:MAG: VWA domain-containing protein [Planctomycetes bacterium]|nr:VWA domain-containing protein [Planctomycetota bacterium]